VTAFDLLALPGVRAVAGALLGAIIGSFLGALVTRWPRGEGVVRGRSHCDGCARVLKSWEMVPVLGALVLRFRCRTCGASIDPAQWVLEAGCAFFGGVAFVFAPGPLPALAWCLLGWTLLALAILDARHFWLPDRLTLPLAGLGLTVGLYAGGPPLWDRAIGAVAGYGVIALIAWGYRAARGREGIGLGDAKLLGAIGAWTGWALLPMVLLVASLAGLGWALVRSIGGEKLSADSALPLGTFLCLAVLPAFVLGQWLHLA
jgi:leader peptidase (prepilin peptidase)/N-methyltransferase